MIAMRIRKERVITVPVMVALTLTSALVMTNSTPCTYRDMRMIRESNSTTTSIVLAKMTA